MQSFSWAPEHCEALRVYRGRGLSYGEIARILNAKFGTAYTRNAALGRGMRMGLPSPERPVGGGKRLAACRASDRKGRAVTQSAKRPAIRPTGATGPVKRRKPVPLRCVGVTPRLISLVQLERGDCRYPYGGDRDGEAISFCGHPRLPGSSYCAPHFRLTLDDGTSPLRAVGRVMLRLVCAA
jgi:GcrA cell cycle regulator